MTVKSGFYKLDGLNKKGTASVHSGSAITNQTWYLTAKAINFDLFAKKRKNSR
jgi:hypothetical protein